MKRLLQSLFFPGGMIFLAAVLVLSTHWLNPSVYGVSFFYYAVFIAAVLLAWRFHSTRILLAAVVLLLAHQAIAYFTRGPLAGGVRGIAFDGIAVLVPVNFILLSFFPERGYQGRSLFWFLVFLFVQGVFVKASARPEQPAPSFLHYAPLASVHSRLPQPALFAFLLALIYLLVRLIQRQRPTIAGLMWSLLATLLAFEAGASGKTATAYFGSAALILASSIVENSYSLAYRDELTGLQSRRAFNDAVLRLKPPYAVAAVDIDHFKSINDTYGHDIGDEVLRMVASRLARVGGGGEAYRVGGEEFTILFPGQNGRGIVDYLELLRLEIESSTFRVRSGLDRRKVPRPPDRRSELKKKKSQPPPSPSGTLSVTVSIGIGESQPKASSEEIISQADQALYQAKRGGRNRIETGVPERKILGFRRKPKQS
jgi:diguanylate cyclase (GGDEF)-like protein